MAREVIVVNQSQIEEYGLFGWTFERNAADGKAILCRDNEDPRVIKLMGFEHNYHAARNRLNNLQLPVKEETIPMVLKVIIALFLFPIGLLVFLIKTDEEKYNRDLEAYNRERKELEAQIQNIIIALKHQ